MQGSSDSSFIPKRGPVAQKRRVAPKQVYVLTLVSYVLMFAALLSAGGVFLYNQFITDQFKNELTSLNQEIIDFSESDMQEVMEFDLRLQQAQAKVNAGASIVAIFEALEQSTISTVQLLSLELERQDETLALSTEFEADSFDSVIFQRGVLNRNNVISPVAVADVSYATGVPSEESDALSTAQVVTFNATFDIPVAEVPHRADATVTVPAPVAVSDPIEVQVSSSTIASPEAQTFELDDEVIDGSGAAAADLEADISTDTL